MSSGAEAGADAIGGDQSSAIDPSAVVFGADGLVPAIAQDATTGEVLMLAWMNAESLSATLREGRMVYWSRSRRELWRKGDTSGHHQMVREAWIDCDADALLFRVDQVGVACHTGEHTCFHRRLDLDETSVIGDTNLAEDTDV